MLVIFFFSIQARIDLNKHVKYCNEMFFPAHIISLVLCHISTGTKYSKEFALSNHSNFSYIKLAFIQAEGLQIFNLPGFSFFVGKQ